MPDRQRLSVRGSLGAERDSFRIRLHDNAEACVERTGVEHAHANHETFGGGSLQALVYEPNAPAGLEKVVQPDATSLMPIGDAEDREKRRYKLAGDIAVGWAEGSDVLVEEPIYDATAALVRFEQGDIAEHSEGCVVVELFLIDQIEVLGGPV